MEHRVLIAAHHNLFARGLESMLLERPGVRVIGTIDTTNGLIDAVSRLHPDAVIVEGDACDFVCLLGEFPMLRVIAVTLDSSSIDVIDSTHITRAGVDELVAAVSGGTLQGGISPS
jgi:DNA-binding NarL/FixJ family response regulator